MDKVTRILLLYKKLMSGEKVNKSAFCNETHCLHRSFDRDIEDIRNFLCDSFELEELIYDRRENAYYICKSAGKTL